MATDIIERPILERPIVEHPYAGRASWGGIFAGLFTGIGLWLLLVLIGTAIGLSALNPRDSGSWGGLGTGLGIWAGIAAILATFGGAFVAGRLSGNGISSHGVLHGVALWGLMSALTFYAGFGLVTELVGTVTNVIGGAAGAVGSVAGQLGGQLGSAVSPNALVDQANKYLESQGKPPVPPEQLKAAISDLEQQAMTNAQNGQPLLDHDTVVQSLSQKTNLSRQDADAVATQIEGAVNQASQGVKQGAKNLGKTAENVGLAAIKGVRTSVWLLYIGAFLNLCAAILGGLAGAAGTRRLFKRHARLPLEPRKLDEEHHAGPPLRPREV